MHVRLLKTFSWSKVKISCHLRNRFIRSKGKNEKKKKANIIPQERVQTCAQGVFELKALSGYENSTPFPNTYLNTNINHIPVY